MTPLQKAATELMDAMVQTDFTCRLGNQLDALEKALEAQSVKPVATVQCINGVTIGYLDVMQPVGTKLYLHPVPATTGERAELIAGIKHELAEFAHNKTLETLLLDAADMLEADVSLINEGNKAQQVAVPDGWALVPIEPTEEMIVALMCTGLRHAEYRHGCDPTIAHMAQGYTAMLAAAQGAKLVTQQVAVPMTEAQIFACDPVPHVMFDQQRIDFARAIEAHHGIGAKP